MGAEEKLGKAKRIAELAGGLIGVLVDIEREDDDGRVDSVTILGIPVYDRANRARRLARRRDRRAKREGRDAP